MTPFLLVDADIEGVEVPEQHVRDGKIILNIAPGAVQEIAFEDEQIYFSTRFSGQAFIINVLINAVLAIYAKENGQGMMFAEEESLQRDNERIWQEIEQKVSSRKTALRIVKQGCYALQGAFNVNLYTERALQLSVHHPIVVPLPWQYQIQLGLKDPLDKQRLFR